MKVCWDGDRVVYPVDNFNQVAPTCPNPVEIDWGEGSLPIRINSEIPDPAIELAMMVWNETVGFELFVPGKIGWDMIITLAPSPGEKESGAVALAGTVHFKDHGHLGAIIFAYETMGELDGYQRIQVYVHELGHVLGLGHDVNDVHSLMYPAPPLGDIGSLTQLDIEAVKKKYGRTSKKVSKN